MAVGNAVIDLFSTIVQIDGTTIGGISDDGIPFPAGSSKIRDVSTQDSGIYTEKRLGRYDAGNVALKGNYIPADAGQIALAAAANDRAVHGFTIDTRAYGGNVVTFDGLVTKFQPGNNSNTETFNATIECTGNIVISSTYIQPSALSFTASGTLTPAFGAAVTNYVNVQAGGAASATVTVTVAAPSTSLIYLMTNTGTCLSTSAGYGAWVKLTSASPSGNISRTAVSTVTTGAIKIIDTATTSTKVATYINFSLVWCST